MGAWIFFRHLYTRNSPSEDVHLEFSYWFGKFSSFNRLILFWNLIIFKTRNIYCLKNYEEPWFKHWKCVVPLLKLCISYFDLQYVESCANFHSVNEGGWGVREERVNLQVLHSKVVLHTCLNLLFFIKRAEAMHLLFWFTIF